MGRASSAGAGARAGVGNGGAGLLPPRAGESAGNDERVATGGRRRPARRQREPLGSPAPPHLPEGTALGEDRSVALALLWNRDLRAFRLNRGIAAGEVISAGALANPEIRTELTHLQRRDLSQLGWDVRLSWEPPRPGVRAGRIGAASARLDEVEYQVREREWDLACDVRTAHATLVAIDEEIRVAQDTIANRQRLADAVSRRVAKGGTTRFDLDLVRLSLASAEHAESQRRLERTLAATALTRLVGVGAPGGAVTVSGTAGRGGRRRCRSRPGRAGGSRARQSRRGGRRRGTPPRFGRDVAGGDSPPAGPGSACRRCRACAGTNSSAPPPIWCWAST